MDDARTRKLLDKWKDENRALAVKVNTLMEARQILPKGIIDAPIHELLSERVRLQDCILDLQELLFDRL